MPVVAAVLVAAVGREGAREGVRERGSEGASEGGSEGWSEGARERGGKGGKEEGREGGSGTEQCGDGVLVFCCFGSRVVLLCVFVCLLFFSHFTYLP